MKHIIYPTLLLFFIASISISCKEKGDEPTIAKDTMNYDMNETAVINAGWTKTMDEGFGGDLSLSLIHI